MDRYFRFNEKINGYSIRKFLGEGRYGIAYLAVNEQGKKCVVKQLKREMLERGREKLFYEEQILRRLNDPRFPRFLSKFQDEFREGYLLEYMEGKVFYDLLSNGHQFNRRSIYNVGSQLLNIIDLLQMNSIVHRDIRTPNVIMKGNGELALIDFGLARYIDNVRYMKETDYWYFGDFLLYLYYTSYQGSGRTERPWFEELDLRYEEKKLLKKLMGLEGHYHSTEEIKAQFERIKGAL